MIATGARSQLRACRRARIGMPDARRDGSAACPGSVATSHDTRRNAADRGAARIDWRELVRRRRGRSILGRASGGSSSLPTASPTRNTRISPSASARHVGVRLPVAQPGCAGAIGGIHVLLVTEIPGALQILTITWQARDRAGSGRFRAGATVCDGRPMRPKDRPWSISPREAGEGCSSWPRAFSGA